VQKLHVSVADLMAMTDEQIRQRFKDSDYVLKLKKDSVETKNEEEVKKALWKYLKCPECKAPIEKIEGYIFREVLYICNLNMIFRDEYFVI
jgi:hypothetical protein